MYYDPDDPSWSTVDTFDGVITKYTESESEMNPEVLLPLHTQLQTVKPFKQLLLQEI